MRKEIKRIGTGAGIYLDKNDLKVYNFRIGDIVEIDIKIIKKINTTQTG